MVKVVNENYYFESMGGNSFCENSYIGEKIKNQKFVNLMSD